MTLRTKPWPPGTPCWADLTVPDVPAAQAFYGAVLGWTCQPTADEFGGYTIAQVRDAAAAGIGPLPSPDVPTAWTLYLAADDVDRVAESVAPNGGTLLLPPGDVGALGRMCIAADPGGAVFGVWQAGTHIGASVTSEPGGLAWEDLRSTDPDAARAFYRALFGFETTPLAEAGPDYHTFGFPGDPAPLGGMGGMFGAPAGTPSHWLPYFEVADADVAVAAVAAAGGRVLTPVMETPYGRMAGVVDPFGAGFTVTQNTGQAVPER